MKRKRDESAFEFRKRKKKERFRKEHRYDSEKQYWKNESKQITRDQKSGIEKLFAGVSGARTAKDMYDFSGYVEPVATAVEGMFANPYLGAGAIEGMGSAITAGAAVGAGLSIAGAAGVGYLAGELINSVFTQNNIQTVKSMTGTYQGKFALSARTAFKGIRDRYQKRGAVVILENFGSVADPDLVYIGHSSWSEASVATAICHAILRKLFRVGAKLDVVTPYEELPLVSVVPDSGPNGFEIWYETKDTNGTTTVVGHTIPNDSSLQTILGINAGGFQLYDNIVNSFKIANAAILSKIYLYQKNNANSEARLVYCMDLAKEVLHVAMSSHMVVQNRTKSASGAVDSTSVDAQPLKGPVYEFSVGCPKLKAGNPPELQSMISDGLILVRSGQLLGSDVVAYKEPPVKNAFQNIVKSGYVRLNPGALKSMTVGTDCKGYYQQVLFKLRNYVEGSTVSRCYGKSQMVCLEEELNSGSANNITVSYECQHIAGADLVTTSNPNMQPGYFSAAINNLPA